MIQVKSEQVFSLGLARIVKIVIVPLNFTVINDICFKRYPRVLEFLKIFSFTIDVSGICTLVNSENVLSSRRFKFRTCCWHVGRSVVAQK